MESKDQGSVYKENGGRIFPKDVSEVRNIMQIWGLEKDPETNRECKSPGCRLGMSFNSFNFNYIMYQMQIIIIPNSQSCCEKQS